MDLDYEELKATRKLNGADRESNIEEDIKLLKSLDTTGDKEFTQAIENILLERKQDKKRIKKLEEENKKKSIENICYQEELENSIPVQKVKDKIEEYKKQKDKYESETQEVFANNYYHRKILELTHKILGLEKLLEDK